jgi:hypothetical protein
MDSLARLIGWKLALHGAPITGQVALISAGGESNRYPSGTAVPFERISGHRDGDSTSCPGDVLYGQLADLRTRASRYGAPIAALTMQTSKTVRGVKPSRVSGELHFADGSSPSGAALDVEYQAAGSAWTRIAGAVCGLDGSWTSSVVLQRTGRVRAVFPGDATRPRLESSTISVRVVPSLTVGVSKARVRRRRAVTVRGKMAPASARVTITFERRVGRRWVKVQKKRIAVTDNAFRTIVRPPVAGRYRLSVKGGGIVRRRRLTAT